MEIKFNHLDYQNYIQDKITLNHIFYYHNPILSIVFLLKTVRLLPPLSYRPYQALFYKFISIFSLAKSLSFELFTNLSYQLQLVPPIFHFLKDVNLGIMGLS